MRVRRLGHERAKDEEEPHSRRAPPRARVWVDALLDNDRTRIALVARKALVEFSATGARGRRALEGRTVLPSPAPSKGAVPFSRGRARSADRLHAPAPTSGFPMLGN